VGSRRLSALLVAGACALGLLCTWLIAFGTDAGLRLDQRIYDAVAARRTAQAAGLATHIRQLADPGGFLVLVAVVLAVPVLRRRWLLVAAVAAVVMGANATTQVLQELTYGGRHVVSIPRAYWPSGHTTAIVSLALGLLISVPRPARIPVGLFAVAAAVAMGWAVTVLGSHLPSDIVGAVFVCGMWAAAVQAGMLWLDRQAPEDRAREQLDHQHDPAQEAGHVDDPAAVADALDDRGRDGGRVDGSRR
jgi:membrane-associated phospholipid phosphatase